MRFIIFFFCYFMLTIRLLAQADSSKASAVFPTDPLDCSSRYKQIFIKDYAFIIDEDSNYSFTVDFIRRIKNAYYIGAHTTVLDSTIFVKILEPRIAKPNRKGIIQVGNSYEMCLMRYYPYPLSHTIDYYINYNFLFGKRLVSMQSTDCLSYIFFTNNLEGLYYTNMESKSFVSNGSTKIQNIHNTEIVYNIFLSIVRKDKSVTEPIVDGCAVIANAKKQADKYSLVDHRHIHCVPPFKLKTKRYKFNHDTKKLNLSEKLCYILMGAYSFRCAYDTNDIFSSITVQDINLVYDNESYVTYRLLWTSSLIRRDFCTYFSFKLSKNGMKLVGICSCLH